MSFLRCKNLNIDLSNAPLVMGIVNVTPDSFSDGGDFFDSACAIKQALDDVSYGADIIDLGAQSTRPGYTEISPDEEIDRLTPVILGIRERSNCPISIDTYFPQVAKKALELGASIINDVSGVFNEEMAQVVLDEGAGWIIMHNGEGSIDEVGAFFDDMAKKCEAFGLEKGQICFDMGIGFGKTRQQDLELISNIKKYKPLGFPLLLGTSRKRVIGEFSKISNAKDRDFSNIAAHTVAALDGVDIIRLHNVKDEIGPIRLTKAIKEARK